MKEPPIYLQPLLHTIEQTVIILYEEFPKMTDNDVEFVYDKLASYYKAQIGGKEVNEPESSIDMRQDMMDEILNAIDLREEIQADIAAINNPNMRHGEHLIPNLAYLYAIAFKRLKTSAKNWRKRNGKKGYLNFISRFI